MKVFIFLLMNLVSIPRLQADTCRVEEYLNSVEGREKISALYERSKSLLLSKLEDFGIEENQILINKLSKTLSNNMHFSIEVRSSNFLVDGSYISYSQLKSTDECKVVIIFYGGRLLSKDKNKDFGSLGKVKETIRIN